MAQDNEQPRDGGARIDPESRRRAEGSNLEEYLRHMLDRTKDVMDADTATVLLLDNSGSFLTARAARGLEEEVRQGVRIRVGQGFAGRIASQREPVKLDRVDPSTVANPVLWEKGVHALAGVPLMEGTRLVGVLHVGRLSPRPFKEEDLKLLEGEASGFGAAITSRELEVEHIAARVLQQSLLPATLPSIPGIEFAARYVPAEEGGVGGDWYDAFRPPSGELWVMVGDIAGHGFGPAVVMGRLRATLRSYALLGNDPGQVLALADRKLQFFEPGSTATALCAVLRPPYESIEIASAGHPPPVLVTGDRPATLIDVQPAPLLGAVENLAPRSIHVPFEENAIFLAYTDGLIERRGESLTVGLDRLIQSVESVAPEILCGRVMDRMIGNLVPRDDIAVIAMKRTAVLL